MAQNYLLWSGKLFYGYMFVTWGIGVGAALLSVVIGYQVYNTFV